MQGFSYKIVEGVGVNYDGIPGWSDLYENVKTVTIVDDGIQPVNMDYWFGCMPVGLGSVGDLAYVNYSSLVQINNLEKIDTSKTTSMQYTFSYSGKLKTVNVSSWDTSNVVSMHGCFCLTHFENLDLSGWNTSSVKDMSAMFDECGYLTTIDLSNFDVSNVEDLGGMFMSDIKLKSVQGIEKWNTSKVTDMSTMFGYCSSLISLDLSKWNTSKVTDMGGMFTQCTKLKEIKGIEDFDTSNSTDMSWMFYLCESLTADCSKWNVSKVTEHARFNEYASGVTAPNWVN